MLVFTAGKDERGNHNNRAADTEQAAEQPHHNSNSCKDQIVHWLSAEQLRKFLFYIGALTQYLAYQDGPHAGGL